MRRRLYFLLPSEDLARTVVDELLLARVESRHIHVLGRDDKPLDGLPEAGILQRSDVLNGIERGLVVGGGMGALAGLVTFYYLPATPPGGAILLGGALFGALFGAWVSSMIGVSVRNSRLKPFEPAIERGYIILMVDVGRDRINEIRDLVKSHHPEADVRGTEPTIPAFP